MSTEPRHVLVTGATRGIGRTIAQDLGRDSHILAGGRDRAAVEALVAELPSAQPFVCDLADEGATAAAAGRLERLDAVVHNAGVADGGRVEALTRQQMREVFEVNVFAVVDLTRLLLPLLRASGRGHVVAINSGAGFMTGSPGSTAYNGSKHALRVFTDALREEERGQIRVTSIHPGRTHSDMQRRLQEQMGRRYDESEFVTQQSVADTVRLALDATAEAQIESLVIRPVFKG